ncbi:MAG: V-type ATPase 116kDa subunit family protein [Microscillaceae bacterium]
MIVRMQKYRFWVHHQEVSFFLLDLQALGILHIEEQASPMPPPPDGALYQEAKETLLFLEKKALFIPTPETQKEVQQSDEVIAQSLHWIKDWQNRQKTLYQVQQSLAEEIEMAEIWGDFSAEKLQALRAAGLQVQLYSFPKRQWQKESKTLENCWPLAEREDHILLAWVGTSSPTFTIAPLPQPRFPRSYWQAEWQKNQAQIQALEAELAVFAQTEGPRLHAQIHRWEAYFRQAYALAHSQDLYEGRLRVLVGWAPQGVDKALEQLCQKRQIFFESLPLNASDQPPVLLKNNFFARLFEPIGQLYALPRYRELDLTPFFAPFFFLFFGFCLGDAGYGLLLLLGAGLYQYRAHPSQRPYLRLAQWLGGATVLFGLLTGTFFGLEMAKIPALAAWKNYILNQHQILQLALTLGLIQILFGLCIKAYNQYRQQSWAAALDPLGWVVLILSLLDLYLIKWRPEWSAYTVYLGIALIVLFYAPESSWGSRLGAGIWDLYNITGFFGDVLSYIRLFALGISSSILGFVINDIAQQILQIDYIGWLLFVLFLGVGHLANLLIASLGAFVHPMRLTFVEFYKNAGFQGGGRPYRPYRKDFEAAWPGKTKAS